MLKRLAILGVLAPAAFVAWMAASPVPAGADDSLMITGAKTKVLLLYDGKGKLVKKRSLSKDELPIPVLAISENGRLLMQIDNDEFWVPKALVKLNLPLPKVSGCQKISKSYASSRGFGDCK